MQANLATVPGTSKIKGQFGIAPAWIQDHPAVSATIEAVWTRLARFADYSTWLVKYVSHEKLGALVDRSRPVIQNALNVLKSIGAVSWKKGGFGWTNEYTLHPNKRQQQREIGWDTASEPAIPLEPPETPTVKVACRQLESPPAPIQNLPQKEEEGTHLSQGTCRKREARRFVAAVKKGGVALGIKVVSRSRDIGTVAHRMGEYNEPFETWKEVYCWLYDHREGLSPFQRGCLASPVQFADQLSRIASDMQGAAGYHEWAAKRRQG